MKKSGSLKHSLGMALQSTIPKAFGFEAATRLKNSNLLIQAWYTDDLGDTK
jgi:hypothetical protein